MNVLPKMDTGMLEKADKLLGEEKTISTRASLRFMIEMMSEEYRALNSMVENQNEVIRRLQEQQEEIDRLKNNNVLLWAKGNRLQAIGVTVGLLILNSMVNWAGIRKPLLKAALGWIGIDVPMDVLP